MNVVEIINLVASLVPIATNLIQTLTNAGVDTGKSNDTVVLIGSLTPIAASLVAQIELIRTQTEAQYPAVWENVRTDWLITLAQWNALQAQ